MKAGLRIWAFAALAVSTVAAPGSSQIYEWVAPDGTRHFTTSMDHVPEQGRADARVYVEAGPMSTIEDESPMSTIDEPVAAAGESADLDEDADRDMDEEGERLAFEDGMVQGLAAGFAQRVDEPPVVVVQSPAPVVIVQRDDPSGQYFIPPLQGTLSVPFDGGRSRGLTRRQLLQETHRFQRHR